MTPAYASPEQLRGEPLSFATDVYSLGLVLRDLIPNPDRDLASILSKCLAQDPAWRYPTAVELAADIDRSLAGYAVIARNGGPVYQTERFLRRHWVSSVAVGCALVIGLVAASGTLRPDIALRARALLTPNPHRAVRLLHLEATTVRPGTTAFSARLDGLFLEELQAGGLFDPGGRPPISGRHLLTTSSACPHPGGNRGAGRPAIRGYSGRRFCGAGYGTIVDRQYPDPAGGCPQRANDRDSIRTGGDGRGGGDGCPGTGRDLTMRLGGPDQPYRTTAAHAAQAAALYAAAREHLLSDDIVKAHVELERAVKRRHPAPLPSARAGPGARSRRHSPRCGDQRTRGCPPAPPQRRRTDTCRCARGRVGRRLAACDCRAQIAA